MLDVQLMTATQGKEAQRRLEERIQRLREEARTLVEQISDLEAHLPRPPARICACCRSEMPSAHDAVA